MLKLTLNKIKETKRLVNKSLNMLMDIADKSQQREIIFYKNKLNDLIDEVLDENVEKGIIK